jgi:hypothetical protein
MTIANVPEQYIVRLVVAGGRNFKDTRMFVRILEEVLSQWPKQDVQLVSGMAKKGPDEMVVGYWKEHGYASKEFPANWENLGKGAGMFRNADMAEYCTHLLAFWDGESKGTANMIDNAIKRGRVVYQVLFDPDVEVQDEYIPAFTATYIEHNRLLSGRALIGDHAVYLSGHLKQPRFPEDHTTFPIEALLPAFASIREEIDQRVTRLHDPQLLLDYMRYVENNQLWITARRCLKGAGVLLSEISVAPMGMNTA